MPTSEMNGTGVSRARVVVVGAGVSGLGTAIGLQRRGCEDFVVLERGADVGGTWWHNTYLGCRCDTPSRLYSFAFAPNPDWSETYARQPEIQAYLRGVAEREGSSSGSASASNSPARAGTRTTVSGTWRPRTDR